MRAIFFAIITVFFVLISLPLFTQADEIDDISKQLTDLKRNLDSSLKATKTNEKNHQSLTQQLEGIKAKVLAVSAEIQKKEKEVKEGEKALSHQKVLLDERAVSYYKNLDSRSFNLIDILVAQNLSESLQNYFYQQTIIEEDRRTIVKLVVYIKDLEEKKAKLHSEQERLAVVKQEVDKQSQFLAAEIQKAKTYEAEIQKKIAELSVKQQQLIAQKLSSLNLPASLGAGPLFCTDDRKLDPGFRPAFAFFTYGIPHRVGMNQYGALGRAKAGQDFKTILNAYYNNIRLECRSTPSRSLKVQGFGDVRLEEYLKGIYEMPESWPLEALKSQVVAARSYALTYTNNGEKEICTTQSCQVYKGGNKGGQWEQAVRDTGEGSCSDGQGLVAVSNDSGEVITAWYASTFGGYTLTSGDIGWSSKPWTKRSQDTTSGVGTFGELAERAYDRESPCFYAAQGYRTEYAKSAWLKAEEVADIANVLLLAKADSGVQNHLSQPDKPNPDGAETWDREKVKAELRSRGGNPFSSVSDIIIGWDSGGGKTTAVTISGDAGSHTFDANEFRNFFNLRAPANIQIVGPLFNIEKK